MRSSKQSLLQTQQVEVPHVVTRAAPEKVTARSRRNSVLVAAIVGLLIGLVAALCWEPLTARFAPARRAA